MNITTSQILFGLALVTGLAAAFNVIPLKYGFPAAGALIVGGFLTQPTITNA